MYNQKTNKTNLLNEMSKITTFSNVHILGNKFESA